MSQFNNKEFLALKKKWYKKLDKDGFKDQEKDEDSLKEWSSSKLVERYTELTYTAKQEYYALAGQFLYEYEFEGQVEKRIWELHSTGQSVRNIVIALKQNDIKAYRRQVHETIQKLAKEMINKCR